jgi:hypothetical protein
MPTLCILEHGRSSVDCTSVFTQAGKSEKLQVLVVAWTGLWRHSVTLAMVLAKVIQ